MKCLSKDRNNNVCRNNIMGDTRFCKLHQYMNEYTDEMLLSIELCKGCSKMYYFDTEHKTCINCIERGNASRLSMKSKVIMCKKESCKFKQSKQNEYCGKHQLCIFENETRSANKKLCANYVRGCKTQLDLEYSYSRCPDCLQKDRVNDKQRRTSPVECTDDLTKKCTTCCKILPRDDFVGMNTPITKTCKYCREQNKIQDEQRNVEHRNELARINDRKPERLAVKAEWKENNYDKIAFAWMNARQNKINTVGIEEFLKQNSEYAQKWRDNNPEKTQENNENKKNNKSLQYNVYSRTANYKNLLFEITFEQFSEIVILPCNYCGFTQDKGFNGIDRMNSMQGYLLENCVSCCQMCNYIKGSLSVDAFINRIEHILTVQKKINGHLCDHCFPNHIKATFQQYFIRANKKGFEFEISEEEYNNITSQNCYICGKINTETNQNGIDRVDSSIGYITTNIRSCCCECNIMKKKYSFTDFIDKLSLIYTHYKKQILPEQIIETPILENVFVSPQNNIITKSNKKSKEEIKEEARLRKQLQRERLKNKYGDEEYKRMRAKEIADNRASQKL